MITEETTVELTVAVASTWMANAVVGVPVSYQGQPVHVLDVRIENGRAWAVIAP